jgi:hypothetical protein
MWTLRIIVVMAAVGLLAPTSVRAAETPPRLCAGEVATIVGTPGPHVIWLLLLSSPTGLDVHTMSWATGKHHATVRRALSQGGGAD